MILIWSSPNVHLGRDAINSQSGEGSCSGGRELSAEGGEPNSFLTPLETGLCFRGWGVGWALNSHPLSHPYLNVSARTHFKMNKVLLAGNLS